MLSDFLLGPFRTRVLSALLLHPDCAWHVRELARQLNAQPGSTNRELIKLADAGILLRQNIGNQVHYRANRDCPVFTELTGLLRKTSGMVLVLAEALAPLANKIQCALVFGSVARGQETAHSDVDVLIIGDIGFGEAVEALHPAQEQVRREINPVVYRASDFRTKVAAGDTWACNVVEKPKLFLIGNADDFAKSIGNSESH